jgi:hypothetical protein
MYKPSVYLRQVNIEFVSKFDSIGSAAIIIEVISKYYHNKTEK